MCANEQCFAFYLQEFKGEGEPLPKPDVCCAFINVSLSLPATCWIPIGPYPLVNLLLRHCHMSRCRATRVVSSLCHVDVSCREFGLSSVLWHALLPPHHLSIVIFVNLQTTITFTYKLCFHCSLYLCVGNPKHYNFSLDSTTNSHSILKSNFIDLTLLQSMKKSKLLHTNSSISMDSFTRSSTFVYNVLTM